MPLGPDGSYNAIDVWRALLDWTLIQKLSGTETWRLVHCLQLAKSLEPKWDEQERLAKEEDFSVLIALPIRELIRCGLAHRAIRSSKLFYIDDQVFRMMVRDHMKPAEITMWVEERIYEILPWLKKQ